MVYLKISDYEESTKYWIRLYTQSLKESKNSLDKACNVLSQINYHLSFFNGLYTPSNKGRFIKFDTEEDAIAFKLKWNY